MGLIPEKRELLHVLPGIGRYCLAAVCLLLLASPARGEEDDLPYLELFNGSNVETVSADRSPRPASQTAENITVVTAKEIEALNAHTLADVLYTVTGVQLEQLRTPGSLSNIEIQGAIFKHVLVLLDNVPINNLSDNSPDISSIPARIIERIEIVKGADSSSWGNALGGVVNVITKSPVTERRASGIVSASIGEHGTADVRGEVSGTVNRTGYYITAGKLHSAGLLPNNGVDLNSVYGKLTYDLPDKGSLTLTTSFTENSSGILSYSPVPSMPQLVRAFDLDIKQLIATFTVQRPVNDRLSMEGVLRTRQYSSNIIRKDSWVPTLLSLKDDEETYGASVKASWLDELQRIVTGIDYDHVQARLPAQGVSQVAASDDRVGIYFNDTLTLGRFALTPSLRFDNSDIGGRLFSPSFGVTYALTDNTVLRGFTARGYSLTSLNRDNTTEKVWTSQIGFETADIPFVWLKGTVFRNDTWDIVVGLDENNNLVKQRQLRQGFELEARTLPLFDTSLSVGYTYIDARNADTEAVLPGVARHTLNLGIKYEDSNNLRALLFGHYTDFNYDPPTLSKYSDIIWDLHLGKKVTTSDNLSFELFASIRNLFNGNQYNYPYINPRRWAEMGVRCAF